MICKHLFTEISSAWIRGGIGTVSAPTAEREASGKLPGKGAKPLAQRFKSEIRSTKHETNSNEINTNDKNNSDPMGNLATSALNDFTHCFYRPVSSGPLCVRIDDHLTGIGGLPHDVETISTMIKVNPV